MKLHASSLSAGYGQGPVLHDITTGIEAGGMLGILGPNGSGKTTLLRALAGLLPIEQGRILLNGEALDAMKPQARAKDLAYVSSFIDPLYDCSVRELVLLGRTPHLPGSGQPSPEDNIAVQEALALADLLPIAAKSVHACSSGERQRAYVAMALAQQSPILLLDEPVAHLDIQHALGILALVRELARQGKRSVAITMHDLNLAAHYCTHLLILKNGRVLAQGKPDEVLQADLLSEAYDHPIRVDHTPEGWWIRPGSW